MKPLSLIFSLLIFTLELTNLSAQTSSSLRIVGRAPASVNLDIDSEAQILKARANFPFLMSYRKAQEEGGHYVVRVANEADLALPGTPSKGPLILEIIAP